jgi:hypothetical protein
MQTTSIIADWARATKERRPMVNDERIYALRDAFEKLGTVAELLAAPQEDSLEWAIVRHSVVRARVHVGQQLDRLEGKAK